MIKEQIQGTYQSDNAKRDTAMLLDVQFMIMSKYNLRENLKRECEQMED